MRRLLKPIPKFAFDRLFFRRFFCLLRVLYPELKSTAVLLTGLVLVACIIKEVVAYYVGIIPSEYYKVLGGRDLDSFPLLAIKSVLIVVAKSLLESAVSYLTNMLSLTWRQRLTTQLHDLYFSKLAFYKLNVLNLEESPIDNPDQRMSQDVEKCTRILATDIIGPVIMAPFIIGYYTYKTYDSTGYLGPLTIYIYFVLGTIANKFLLSPVVNMVATQERKEGDFRFKHLSVRSNAEAIAFYQSGKLEKELTNHRLDDLISTQQRLINWRFPLSFSTNSFDYFGAILCYLISAIPIFVLHLYDHLKPEDIASVISKNAFFYMYLINSFSKVIDLSGKLGDLAGTTHRVVELLEEVQKENSDALKIDSGSRPPSEITTEDGRSLKSERSEPHFGMRADDYLIDMNQRHQLHTPPPPANTHNVINTSTAGGGGPEGAPSPPPPVAPPPMNQAPPLPPPTYDETVDDLMVPPALRPLPIEMDERCAFHLDRVTYTMPNDPGFLLVADLSMKIVRNQNVLITGDSSAGKTSVFRILAGLWHCTGGRLETHWRRSNYTKMMFVPQRPYLPVGAGTLRQQLCYPQRGTHAIEQKETERLERILADVRLEGLINRCGGLDCPVEFDWQELSPGEAQRVSLARVLYHRPMIAFLDESTSALGFDLEQQIYQALHKSSITVVSIGHRTSLKRHHHIELRLDGSGGWNLLEIEQSLSSASRPASSIVDPNTN